MSKRISFKKNLSLNFDSNNTLRYLEVKKSIFSYLYSSKNETKTFKVKIHTQKSDKNNVLYDFIYTKDLDDKIVLHLQKNKLVKNQKKIYLNRLIYFLNFGKIKRDENNRTYHIHHKNFNSLDNRPENLEQLPEKEHNFLHCNIKNKSIKRQKKHFTDIKAFYILKAFYEGSSIRNIKKNL